MYRYLFIVNPVAGGGRARELEEPIRSYMEARGADFSLIYTRESGQASSLVLDGAGDFDVFVAVGGDGTIKEVAEGVHKLGAILSIIPMGTGNDLAKALDYPGDLAGNLDRILRGQLGWLDVNSVNGQYFFNIASIGFDSQLIVNYGRLLERRGRSLGRPGYFLALAYTFFNFRPRYLELDLDGEGFRGRTTLLALGNGSYYGGYFKVLPESRLDDGYIHVCLVRWLPRILIFLAWPFLLLGRHGKFKRLVSFHRVKSLEVRSQEGFYLNLDGELLDKTRSADFRLEGSIRLI